MKRFRDHGSDDETHLLREIMRVQQAIMAVFTREVGVPSSRFALLRLLANAGPEGTGTMALARRLGIDAAAVTRQVREMEAEGLLSRRDDPADGRRSLIRLSAKGLREFRKIHDRGHEFEEAFSATISPEDMATATRVLVELRKYLEGLR